MAARVDYPLGGFNWKLHLKTLQTLRVIVLGPSLTSIRIRTTTTTSSDEQIPLSSCRYP
jgi:hypothetical protein